VRIRIRAVLWGLAGAVALISIVVAAVVAFEPSSAEAVTVAVGAVAVAWWLHAWRRLWLDERDDGRVA